MQTCISRDEVGSWRRQDRRLRHVQTCISRDEVGSWRRQDRRLRHVQTLSRWTVDSLKGFLTVCRPVLVGVKSVAGDDRTGD